MILADFRIHSSWSDGSLTIPQIVDLYGEKGFGAIAITDCLYDASSLIGSYKVASGQSLSPTLLTAYEETLKKEIKRAWEEYRLVVLPGIEYAYVSFLNSTCSFKILGLGLAQLPGHVLNANNRKGSMASELLQETCKFWRQGGALSVALQEGSLWERREEVSNLVDLWEVGRGTFISKKILESDRAKVAGSHFRKREDLTGWKTVLDCERSPQEILKALRRQQVSFRFYDERLCKTSDLDDRTFRRLSPRFI